MVDISAVLLTGKAGKMMPYGYACAGPVDIIQTFCQTGNVLFFLKFKNQRNLA